MPDYEKVPRLLKPSETLDATINFDEWDYANAPLRYTTFVGRPPDAIPTEVFSTAFIPVFGKTSHGVSFRVVDDVCSPACKIGIAESPKIMGIRLGMSLKDFRQLYPNIKISRLHRKLANYKTAYIWAWDWNAYSVGVTFVDDKVARIDPKFKSLNKARDRENFWETVSSTIGMPYFWQPFQSRWKCSDFEIEVITNEDPSITIQTKEYLKIRDRINEDYIKNLKIR